MKVVFIIPCFNAEKNLDKLVNSVFSQVDDLWSAIFIDDMSTDNTWAKLTDLKNKDPRIEIRKNYEKKYALKNIVEVAREFEKEKNTIIAVIDGDDQLCNNDTVDLLKQCYESGNDVVWTAHRWDINNLNISREMPDNVNPYQWPWCTSHLRTFRSSLMSAVCDDNFKNYKNEWFKRGYDQALMLPLLKCTHRRKYIDKTCYLYNINSVSISDRDWAEKEQISTINFVRSRGFVAKN